MVSSSSLVSQPLQLRAARAATTLTQDCPDEYRTELLRLIEALLKRNAINKADIMNVIFTVTSDLVSINPAKIAREGLGWDNVAMICARELDVKGFPPRCVRLLVQFYTTRTQSECLAVYQNDAQKLRPDLS